MSRGRSGATTSVVTYSPQRLKRMKAARKRQEARWAAKAGPVTVRKIGDPKPDDTS